MSPDERGEKREGPGFVVIDRRGQEKEEAPREEAAPPREAPRSEAPLPAVDFGGFAISLASSAMVHLGLVPDPETREPAAPNLMLARHTIDLLEMLEVKTRGNLDAEEERLLRRLLTELRMRFVEAQG